MIKLGFIKLNNLFVYIISLIIIFLIRFYKRNTIPGTLLLVRLDAIGDYILFRNFIKEVKRSSKYKNYKITLCGNILWRELAETFDEQEIDNYIWIDRNKHSKNFLYRYKIFKTIYSKGFEIAVCPTYSREILYDDLIIKASFASERVGSEGALEKHAYWKRKLLTDTVYTTLLETSTENIFEFTRNKLFFEKLLGTELTFQKPYLSIDSSNLAFDLPDKYIVLFPGAGIKFRRWDIKNFLEIASFIINEYSLPIVLAGSDNDGKLTSEIMNEIDNKFIYDLTGKTTLVQLTALLSNSELLISNETGAVHIAVALNKNVICISNGNHLGRFNPYPKEIFDKAYYIYPLEISNKSLYNETYRFNSELDINSIKVEDVKKAIKEILI